MREFSPLALILGVIIAVLFGAANAYVGLKVGMTVSASIPAAVISMAVLKGLLKRGTILENNMVQTIGSSGEGLAAGMIFTIPALYMLGKDNPELIPQFGEMVLWGALGGLLGVFCMIPMRRLLIVKEHGKLPYPEGVACAEVLQAGDRGGASAKPVFLGLMVGGFYELLRGLGFWPETARCAVPVARTEFRLGAEPALLGVGYILGPRIASFMMAGALLAWFVLIPCISHFGQGVADAIFPSSAVIADMTASQIHRQYIRYIGAGAVVLGGLFSLVKSLRTVAGSFAHFAGRKEAGTTTVKDRTDRDIPLPILLLGVVGLGAAVWFSTQRHFSDVTSIAVVVACTLIFGVFFVTVSSRLVGIVGSSSNPASGMTIATLLATALVLVYGFGMTGPAAKGAIIGVGAIVCIAVCLAGDCSQDLKTGFLVRATPWKQQLGEVVGVLAPVAAIAAIIMLLNNTYGFTISQEHPKPLEAPQANIMKLLASGVVDGNLPWILILAGIALGLVVELLGLPSLPFAVGFYLPLELTTPIMAGAVIKWLVEKARGPVPESEDPGVLGASGLVAGQGLVGVTLACSAAFIGWWWHDPQIFPPRAGGSETVLPHHTKDWVAERAGFDPEYGLEPFNVVSHFGPDDGIREFDVFLTDVGPNSESVAEVVRKVRADLYHGSLSITGADPEQETLVEAVRSLHPEMTPEEVKERLGGLPYEVIPAGAGVELVAVQKKLEAAGAKTEVTLVDETQSLLQEAPVVLSSNLSFNGATDLKKQLEEAGASAEIEKYAVEWIDILPLVPFGLLGLWLGIIGLKRMMVPPVEAPE